MRVLLLSAYPEQLIPTLEAAGDVATVRVEPLDAATLARLSPDFVVSYGYRHILRRPVLEALPGRVVNLHISLLPWNRGADPNFWSFLEGTPKGVTIHLVDEGVDTGAILAQRPVTFAAGETLASSYAILQKQIINLFSAEWRALRTQSITPVPQLGGGTSHRAKDKEPFLHLLSQGWNTPVAALEDYGRRHGLIKEHS